MFIEVSESQISVHEAEVLTAFSVRTELERDKLAGQFRVIDDGAWGYVDDSGHVWVSRDAIERAVAESSPGPDWLSSFSGMVAFAHSKGWVSADRDHIRAHVED